MIGKSPKPRTEPRCGEHARLSKPDRQSQQQSEQQSEQGSAYLVALLVLFILTVLGLSVSFITQTEVLIGGAERTIQRTFYAADAGINLAVSKALNAEDFAPQRIDFANPSDVLGPKLVIDRVETSPMVPVSIAPCNFCELNQGSVAGASEFSQVVFAMTARATRLGQSTGGTDLAVLGVKEISSMVNLQPIRTPTEMLQVTLNQTSSIKLRY